MGAYEGAGNYRCGQGRALSSWCSVPFGNGPDTGTVATEGQCPLSTRLLTNGACPGSE